MEDFRRMIIKVSDVEGASATIPVSNDHTDGSWLITDIYEGELFLNLIDNILQTRTDAGIINLNASSSSDADRVVQDVRYDEGVEKGEPLKITGYNVGSGIITVEKADASASAEMPSYGLAMANYSSGATGQMIAVGTLTDVNTSAFSEGDTVYVAVGGGLTNVKPIEPNLIQNVGFVARSNANNGSIEVVAIGRANDVPNLPLGHTFIGTSTNPTTIDLTTELNNTNLIPTLTESSSRILAITDKYKNIENSSDITITIPLHEGVPFPVGTQIFFTKKFDTMTFEPFNGVTVNSVDDFLTMDKINSGASLLKIGLDEWNLKGDLKVTPVPAFTFTVNTTNQGTASTQFQLPLISNGTISIDVDWGDGTTDTITTYNQAETLHTYSSGGTYTIKMYNEVRGFKFANSGDKLKILNISEWGEFTFTNDQTFRGCTNVTATAIDAPILEGGNYFLTFYLASNWNAPSDSWDLTNAYNMSSMYRSCSFNQPLNSWNVSNVTNFSNMFSSNTSFNQPLNNWDVSSGTNLSNMFNGASAFDQDLGDWQISSITTLSGFLSGGGLSTSNYDSTLIGWASQTPPSNISCSFGNSQYTIGGAGETAREELISTYNWSITDGGGI